MKFNSRHPFTGFILGLTLCLLLVPAAQLTWAETATVKSRTRTAPRASVRSSNATKLDKAPETIVTVTRPGEETSVRPTSASAPAGSSVKAPVIGMLDFESATLDNETQKAVSQALWARLNAAGNVEMLPREPTRNYLISNDLYPFAPYQHKPGFSEITRAIRADYLISGHVDRMDESYTLDANVFSLREGKFILRDAELRKSDMDDLLASMSTLTRQIQSAIRDDLSPAEQAAFSARELSGKKPAESGKSTGKSKRVVAQIKRARPGIKKVAADIARADSNTTLSAATDKPTSATIAMREGSGEAGPAAQETNEKTATAQSTVEAQISAAERAQKLFSEALDTSTPPADRLAKLEEATRLMPNELLYQRQLASEYYRQRDFKKSIAQADRALKIKPNDTMTLTVKGVAHYEAGELDEAGRAYQEALQADSGNHWARFNYALTLTKKKDPGAAQAWREYLARAEGEPTQQNMIADARKQLGALESAGTK